MSRAGSLFLEFCTGILEYCFLANLALLGAVHLT